mgnify:CR=1 FL=1
MSQIYKEGYFLVLGDQLRLDSFKIQVEDNDLEGEVVDFKKQGDLDFSETLKNHIKIVCLKYSITPMFK